MQELTVMFYRIYLSVKIINQNIRQLILFIAVMEIFTKVAAQNCDTNLFPDGQQYFDTYYEVINNKSEWMHHHTHDPTVNKDGNWYYLYSTSWDNDAAYRRKSKDLVNWEYAGTAFDGISQSAQEFFKIHTIRDISRPESGHHIS